MTTFHPPPRLLGQFVVCGRKAGQRELALVSGPTKNFIDAVGCQRALCLRFQAIHDAEFTIEIETKWHRAQRQRLQEQPKGKHALLVINTKPIPPKPQP